MTGARNKERYLFSFLVYALCCTFLKSFGMVMPYLVLSAPLLIAGIIFLVIEKIATGRTARAASACGTILFGIGIWGAVLAFLIAPALELLPLSQLREQGMLMLFLVVTCVGLPLLAVRLAVGFVKYLREKMGLQQTS